MFKVYATPLQNWKKFSKTKILTETESLNGSDSPKKNGNWQFIFLGLLSRLKIEKLIRHPSKSETLFLVTNSQILIWLNPILMELSSLKKELKDLQSRLIFKTQQFGECLILNRRERNSWNILIKIPSSFPNKMLTTDHKTYLILIILFNKSIQNVIKINLNKSN